MDRPRIPEITSPGRPASRLLADPVFGRYFWTSVLSLSGVWAQNIAAAIVMWELTRSATLVGAISVAQFSATLILAPLTGALTDTLDRRRLLMTGRAVAGCATAVLVVVPTLGGSLSAGLLLVVFGVVGLGMSLSAPAVQALLPALIPESDLDQAVALNAVIGNIARAVGPAVGAGLLMVGGPVAAFGFASVGHLAFAAALIGLLPPSPRAGRGRRRILDGARYLRGDRETALLLVGTATLGFGLDPIITLTPALSDTLGSSDAAVGIMASVFGFSAVAAAASLGSLRRRFSLRALGLYGFGVLALGLLVVAGSPVLVVSLAGFAIAGGGFLIATTVLTTGIQRRVPDELRGRVMALWTMAFFGSRPVAAAVNGAIADASSVRTALVVCAVITAGSALTARAGAS